MFSAKGPFFKEASIHFLRTDKLTLSYIEVEKYILVLCTTDVIYKTLRGVKKKKSYNSIYNICAFIFKCFEYYKGSK